MASIKLLRDEKTGNVYECLINDKGEIVQEHFIPSSEVSKHPKFTAPLDEKNRFKYVIPEFQVLTNKTIGEITKDTTIKIIKNVKLFRTYDYNGYELITTYTDNTFKKQIITNLEQKILSNNKLFEKYPELKYITQEELPNFSRIGITEQQETPKKEFNKNILMYFPIASLVVYLLYLAIENM